MLSRIKETASHVELICRRLERWRVGGPSGLVESAFEFHASGTVCCARASAVGIMRLRREYESGREPESGCPTA